MTLIWLKKYEAAFKVSPFGSEIYMPKQESYSPLEIRAMLKEAELFKELLSEMLKMCEVKENTEVA